MIEWKAPDPEKPIPPTNQELKGYLFPKDPFFPGEELYRFNEMRRSIWNEFGQTLSWKHREKIKDCPDLYHAQFTVNNFVDFVRQRVAESLPPGSSEEEIEPLVEKVIKADKLVQDFGMKDYKIGLVSNKEKVDLGEATYGKDEKKWRKFIFGMGWTSSTDEQANHRFTIDGQETPSLMEDFFYELEKRQFDVSRLRSGFLGIMIHVPGFPGAELRKDFISEHSPQELTRLIGPDKAAELDHALLFTGKMQGNHVDELKQGLFSLDPLEVFALGHSYSAARFNYLAQKVPITAVLLHPALLPPEIMRDKYQKLFGMLGNLMATRGLEPLNEFARKATGGRLNFKEQVTKILAQQLMGTGRAELPDDSLYPQIANELGKQHADNVGRTPLKTTAASLLSMETGKKTSIERPSAMITADHDQLTGEETISNYLKATGEQLVGALKRLGFKVDRQNLIQALQLDKLVGGHIQFLDPGLRRAWMQKSLDYWSLCLQNRSFIELTDLCLGHEVKIQVVDQPGSDAIEARKEIELYNFLLKLWPRMNPVARTQGVSFIEIPNYLLGQEGRGIDQIEEFSDWSLGLLTLGEIVPGRAAFSKNKELAFFLTKESKDFNDIRQFMTGLEEERVDLGKVELFINWLGSVNANYYRALRDLEATGAIEAKTKGNLETIVQSDLWKQFVVLMKKSQQEAEKLEANPMPARVLPLTLEQVLPFLRIAMTRDFAAKRKETVVDECFTIGQLRFHRYRRDKISDLRARVTAVNEPLLKGLKNIVRQIADKPKLLLAFSKMGPEETSDRTLGHYRDSSKIGTWLTEKIRKVLQNNNVDGKDAFSWADAVVMASLFRLQKIHMY